MNSNLVIKLAFPDKSGKKVPIELPISAVRGLISELLRITASLPQAAALSDDFITDPNPILGTALAITPIEGNPGHARLSICAGAVDLQFSVPLAPLFEALKALEALTEPDPTSSSRLN
jgi:hypothetical protein